MRERILWWLFGTDEIESYMELLRKRYDHTNECLELLAAHGKTLEREEWALNMLGKLIKICENHGIDIDEEIKHIQLEEVNANETVD